MYMNKQIKPMRLLTNRTFSSGDYTRHNLSLVDFLVMASVDFESQASA